MMRQAYRLPIQSSLLLALTLPLGCSESSDNGSTPGPDALGAAGREAVSMDSRASSGGGTALASGGASETGSPTPPTDELSNQGGRAGALSDPTQGTTGGTLNPGSAPAAQGGREGVGGFSVAPGQSESNGGAPTTTGGAPTATGGIPTLVGGAPMTSGGSPAAAGGRDPGPKEEPSPPGTLASGLMGWVTQHPEGPPTGGTGGESCTVTSMDELAECLNYIRKDRDINAPYTVLIKGHLQAPAVAGGARYQRLDIKPESSNISLTGVVENGEIPTIDGGHLIITGATNVIIQNIRFIAPRDSGVASPEGNCTASDPDFCDWNAEYDAMTIQEDAQRIWLDHCEFTDGPDYQGINPTKSHYKEYDGLLDIKKNSDFITISNTKFFNHDKNILIGANDRDAGQYRITFFLNHFQFISQRSPRVRFGQVHLLNNLYENMAKSDESQKYYHQYVIGLGASGQAYSERNAFDIPGVEASSLLGVGFDAWSQQFTDVGSWLNGENVDLNAAAEQVINAREATENEGLSFIGPVGWKPSDHYPYSALETSDAVRAAVRAGAGVQQ